MLISKGSVKDLYKSENENEIDFLFSDRVSVFDYGALPEEIAGRGEALCKFAKILFKDLNLPSAFFGRFHTRPCGVENAKSHASKI